MAAKWLGYRVKRQSGSHLVNFGQYVSSLIKELMY